MTGEPGVSISEAVMKTSFIYIIPTKYCLSLSSSWYTESNQRKIKAEEKKLKFIAFSYSEKGYCEHLLNIERRLESAVVLN